MLASFGPVPVLPMGYGLTVLVLLKLAIRKERTRYLMIKGRTDQLLTSMLWGGVAAVGQYTMLFLTIIQRIHVRFEDGAPVFFVDPRGPIALTKSSALSVVWVMTVAFGLLVALLVYFKPRPSRRLWFSIAVVAALLSASAAFAEPLWGLVVWADFAALYAVLAAA